MEARYDSPAKVRQPNGEQNDKLSVDGTGAAFVNDDYRSGATITIGTALTFPCDAICLAAASAAVVVQMAEDPLSETVTLNLPAGISKVGVAKVVSATGSPGIVALYHRRPPAEV
jgi:hypothetical protein